ncbi:HNH endonuclease [Candidatus Saccharibacteria bacterium]|nr:MAG: HNH endonuclease [Candidatus Saccharibacteria bacterium]
MRGVNTINFFQHVVRYLWNKYAGKCARCSWSQVNPVTKRPPLEIDHIDGNSMNNIERNLILLCPNCHAITPTHKNLNLRFGRHWRRTRNMLQ